MRRVRIENRLKKLLKKLFKKDRKTFEILMKKIDEIALCENINHYKNLKKPMQHMKRVHIHSSFVLTFSYNKEENLVIFYDLYHHDKAYV